MLTLLAIPPILTNTYVGVRQVDRDSVDAARGIGLTEARSSARSSCRWRSPTIFGGIRLVAGAVVATATIAPLGNVDSLGRRSSARNVYGAAGPARRGHRRRAAHARHRRALSAALQRAVTPQGLKLRPAARHAQALPILSPGGRQPANVKTHTIPSWRSWPCSSSRSASPPAATTTRRRAAVGGARLRRRRARRQRDPAGDGANGGKTITVGSKNFAEQYILGEIYAQALEAAGFTVKKQLDLGSEQVAYKALKGGEVDAYPEYTGTALTSFFEVKTDDVPRTPQAAFEQVKEDCAKDDITALPQTPFENTFRLAIDQGDAEKLGNPKTISELEGQGRATSRSPASPSAGSGPTACSGSSRPTS